MICLDIIPLDKPRWICAECGGLPEFIKKGCARCGAPMENEFCGECSGRVNANAFLDGNRSLFVYDGAAKRMIHNFKYARHPEIARGLGELIKKSGEPFFAADYLTYVPLHKSRAAGRGYNQSLLLAGEISETTGIPLISPLSRIKNTKPQSGLDYLSRAANIEGAFAINNKHDLTNKTVVIVDDIHTTGATLNACAELLKNKGASRVYGFTLAVAVKNAD